MTDLLIRAFSRRPLRTLARPSAVLAFAVAVAYGCGFWLNLLHRAEGGTERNEPGLLLHWLRDATLSLPLVFTAVWLGILLARRVIRRHGAELSAGLSGAVVAGSVALTSAFALGASSPMHAGLFGASHGGPELPYALHLMRDTLLSLAVTLPLCAFVAVALLRREPWAEPQVARWRSLNARQRHAFQAGVALVLVAPVFIFAQGAAEIATAGAGAGAPCPATSPTKRFDVTSLDVKIPLNRFGDNDPQGKMFTLTKRIDDVRAQERTQKVSLGLHGDDAIQPLVIRANMGDCVEIAFSNEATGGEYGIHIDGLAHAIESSGDAIGANAPSGTKRGETRLYRFYVPDDPELEGTHYIRPGPGYRQSVTHGLFGALSVEPRGSVYLHPETRKPLESGWEAIIQPPKRKAFREYALLHHEIGNEDEKVFDKQGKDLPMKDPITTAYRPGARALNYRSEPFMNRLERKELKAFSYNSYTFGDPATPMPRAYLGDASKIRILHAGTEVFHVYHLHGGGIRWRLNPHLDKTYDYEDTGLNKHPKTASSPSTRLDSQAFGPGESYDLEIEGGAGGVQQAAGDFLFHCHIAEHYVAGMWSFWRVYDTKQPDLAVMPDRAAPPTAVTSAGLIGKTMPDGSTISKDNVDDWIKPQLPAAGVPDNDEDGSVWDWKVDNADAGKPLYLGAPETTETNWPNLPQGDEHGSLPGHPGLLPVDEPVTFEGKTRPPLLFNPDNGRPAYPLLRTQVGSRAPFASNKHSGAPWLGDNVDDAPTPGKASPWAGRKDGLCPANAPVRQFNLVSLQMPIQITAKGKVDEGGRIFALAKDKKKILPPSLGGTGEKSPEPLAIRGNIGDCIAVTLTSEQRADTEQPHPMTTMHIHHVQFDPQASDGVGTGMQFGQAVKPYMDADVQLAADAAEGDTTLQVVNPEPADAERLAKLRNGVAIAVGQGTEGIEVHSIKSIERNGSTATIELVDPLKADHPKDEWTGTEFVQSRWYPDVLLDNVFWHDHVDGIHNWGHGLVGQFIVEPKNSTYHDPKTGEQIASGTQADIRTDNPLLPGKVDGSFREFAMFQIDDNPGRTPGAVPPPGEDTVDGVDSTINLRAEPWGDRLGADSDASLLFSSYRHGDPFTPLPKAYPNDPVVLRTMQIGPLMDTFRLDGMRFSSEVRNDKSKQIDTILAGVSEKSTIVIDGGAGGPQGTPGDYLYHNGVGRRFRQGAWGLMRVLGNRSDDLQALPGRTAPSSDWENPTPNGGRPPAAADAGNPCPAGAPKRTVNVSAVDVEDSDKGDDLAYVPSEIAVAVEEGNVKPEPLVVHAAAGDCLEVNLTNRLGGDERVSFDVGQLLRGKGSSGINAGFNPEQTVADGATRMYRFYADSTKIGSAPIADFGGEDTGVDGLYGAVVIGPAGAKYRDPVSGRDTSVGSQVDVIVPGGSSYRDYTLTWGEDEPRLGSDTTPYKVEVEKHALVNYRSEPVDDGKDDAFARTPRTPVLKAYAGDPMKVHVLSAPGSEQPHVFSLGGLSWDMDWSLPGSQEITAQGFGPWQTVDINVIGGAGGRDRTVGDFWYGDFRRAFTRGGMWGLTRVLSDASCPIKPLPGLDCLGQGTLITDGPVAEPGEGGDNPPSPPATPAARPASNAPRQGVKGTATKRTLRNLRASSRVTLGALRRSGLKVRVDAPSDTRVLRLSLLRAKGGSKKLVASRVVNVRKGGTLTVTWRFTARELRALKAGDHVLRVQAGPSRSKLGRTALERRLRLLPGGSTR